MDWALVPPVPVDHKAELADGAVRDRLPPPRVSQGIPIWRRVDPDSCFQMESLESSLDCQRSCALWRYLDLSSIVQAIKGRNSSSYENPVEWKLCNL
jgi:hypothetical protein